MLNWTSSSKKTAPVIFAAVAAATATCNPSLPPQRTNRGRKLVWPSTRTAANPRRNPGARTSTNGNGRRSRNSRQNLLCVGWWCFVLIRWIVTRFFLSSLCIKWSFRPPVVLHLILLSSELELSLSSKAIPFLDQFTWQIISSFRATSYFTFRQLVSPLQLIPYCGSSL